MKKHSIQFLIIALVLGYLSFGIIILSNSSFGEVLRTPLYLLLLILGFLSPFIASLMVYRINERELGGLRGFLSNFNLVFSKKHFLTLALLLAAHYIFGIILNAVGAYGSVVDFIKYLPIMLILMGSQEIGWRRIVQPYYEEAKGFNKSIMITGLFWAIWFLPLIFIKGFMILPQFYAQFAGYLVGLSFLLSTMYKISKQVSYSIILSTLLFALTPVIIFKQDNIILVIVLLELILVSILRKNRATKKA